MEDQASAEVKEKVKPETGEVEISLSPGSLAAVVENSMTITMGHLDNHHAQGTSRLPTVQVLLATSNGHVNAAVSLEFLACRVCQATKIMDTTQVERIN